MNNVTALARATRQGESEGPATGVEVEEVLGVVGSIGLGEHEWGLGLLIKRATS